MRSIWTNLFFGTVFMKVSRDKRKLNHLLKNTFFLLLVIKGASAGAQVSGTVFRDYNSNGTRENTSGFSEPGVGGITISAYDAIGTLIATQTSSTVSASLGQYTFPASGANSIAAGTPVRLEFTNLSTNDYSSFAGGTSVQFVTSGPVTTNVNFAVNYPTDFCQNNPYLSVASYRNGNPLAGGTSANQDALVSYLYNDAAGVPSSFRQDGQSDQVGSVFGLAYNKKTKKLFSAAFLKRHVGWGPQGIGGIYVTDYSSGTPVTSSWINLATLGVSLLPSGAPATLLSNTGATSRNLPANLNAPSNDPDAFDYIGRAGLGDIDISDDNNTLYAVNLAERNIVTIDLTAYNASNAAITAAQIGSITPPLVSCTNGVARPFALKLYKGKLYLGVTCTGENGGATINDVTISVLELDLSSNTWTTVVTPYVMNYTKGQASGSSFCTTWNTWTNNDAAFSNGGVYTSGTTVPPAFNLTVGCRPAPLLSDIEFDESGNMILGILDRSGHQWGFANYDKVGADILMDWRVGGEVLKLSKCTSGATTWTMENDGGLCGTSGSASQQNNQGPGGGEFFYQDFGPTSGGGAGIHQEVSSGTLAVRPGNYEVLLGAMDPLVEFSGGVIYLNSNNGTTNKRIQLYEDPYGGTINGTAGKSHGIGDLELLCDAAPLEIGNRIWLDTDRDGVQDAGENGIANVQVQLFADFNNDGMPEGSALATISTSSLAGNLLGTWVFNNTNVTDGDPTVPGNQAGPQPGRRYLIRIGSADWTAGVGVGDLANLQLTAANTGGAGQPDVRDNDAVLSNNIPTISYLTGDVGRNDHTLDMGFVSCPTITDPSTAQNICVGSNGSNITVNTDYNAANGIRFVRFSSDQMAGGAPTTTEAAAIYAGTAIATVTPTGASSPYTATYTFNAADFPNATAAPITYYVYAILNPDLGAICRPAQEILVTVNPLPAATFTQTAPTCTGVTANNNGIITFTTASNVTNFGISTAGAVTYDGPAYPATAFTAVGQNVSTTIPNTGGAYIVRVFNGSATCFTDVTVTVAEVTCAITCVPPVISVVPGTVCVGNSIDLNSLVTGNSPVGILSFHATLADANAGTNLLLNTVISPLANITYYVRSTINATCYSVGTLQVTVSTPPVLTVNNGQVCPGNSLNLATLVTNSGGGTFSYFTTLTNAQNNINALASPVVAPTSATNYFIRSISAAGCYTIKNVVVSLAAANCGAMQVSGPN